MLRNLKSELVKKKASPYKNFCNQENSDYVSKINYKTEALKISQLKLKSEQICFQMVIVVMRTRAVLGRVGDLFSPFLEKSHSLATAIRAPKVASA